MKKPKVTIGVCARNCESSIKQVINSIINQDFPHELIEVIFVDDGSEDNTLSIILQSIPRMNMVVKVFSQRWKGISSARNLVVENASGDYIIWVDGDMILTKDFVKNQVEFMEKNPKVGIAKGKYGVITNLNTVAALENAHFVVDNNKYEPGTGGSIYRTNAIREIGGFDNNLKLAGEDQDVAYRIQSTGWLLSRSDAVFYEIPRKTWKNLWKKYFLWGYGLHDALHKNSRILSLCRMTPIAGFFAGLIRCFSAYKVTHDKRVFLLPIHFTFKMSAWCYGYIRRQLYIGLRKHKHKIEFLSTKKTMSSSSLKQKPDANQKIICKRVCSWKQRKLKLADPWYRLILKMIKPVINNFEGREVLEVGCGLGGFPIYIGSKKGKCVGLDISKKAIKEAKVLSKKYKVNDQVDFIIADARFLPITRECFEMIVCSETLEHIENYQQAFHELVRVAKKNGFLIVTVPNIFSMLLLEYLYFILMGQPRYVKEFLEVNKEEIFHHFKLKNLFKSEKLNIIEIQGTDFLHLHPKIKKIFPYLDLFSDMLERKGQRLKFFGSHIGVIAKKS